MMGPPVILTRLEVGILNLCKFEQTFDVCWLNAQSVETLPQAIAATKGDSRTVRLLYIGTQLTRVYVLSRNGVASFVPFAYQEGCWTPLFIHQWRVDRWDDKFLASEEQFYEYLERQMLLQFSACVTGWYDNPPSSSDVLSVLVDGDTVETLDYYRFSSYSVEVQRDPEWDGAVQVLCDGGTLLLPYAGQDKQLILKYATFVADSVGTKVSGVLSGVMDKCFSFFGNLHWSNFRYRINQIGGSNKNGNV